MIKTVLLFTIFCLTSFESRAQMASTQSLRSAAYEADLPLFESGVELGEVKARVEGEKIIWLEKESLLKAIGQKVSAPTYQQMTKLNSLIDPSTLSLPITFNPQELRLEMTLELKQRSSDKLDLLQDYQKRYGSEALRPAPLGGAINYRVEQGFGEREENKFFSTQFDSFLNLHSLVLENQTFYQSNQDQKWFRGDTRLVKDFEGSLVRLQVGDVFPLVQGFMVSRPIGGINISRNFSLNPYRLPYPTGQQNFSLNSRSFVKYFVNGALIRSEYLPAGNYTARDIPLNNGLNTVTIEATDDLGQKKIFVFRAASSINLLNQGESRFDLSYGVPFIDANFKRQYLEGSEGKLLSGFWQYGFSSNFSASIYGQNQLLHSLGGTELIRATTIGNFSAGFAQSIREDLKGNAQSLTYQFIGEGQSSYSQTLALRYEHRSDEFRSTFNDLAASIQNNYAATYTLPVISRMTIALGGNYGDVRNNALSNRYGYDTTLNLRIMNHHNLSIFAGRTRDEFKQWNNVAYVFLTIAFAGSNDFVSAFHDKELNNSKLTYIHDNQNRLYKPRAQALVENGDAGQGTEADLLLPTPFAELGGRVRGDHLIASNEYTSRGSLRLNSALAFAYQDGDLALGISRPVNNSFVLFKPEPRLKDQRLALKSTSPFNESESGPFKEITFGNLLPYQYREIQIDPGYMDVGRTIRQEKYVIYPTYKSAHFIRLEERGSVILKGRLFNSSGSPYALQVGQVGGKTFFTNRSGEFFIEGLEAGTHLLKLNDTESSLNISINPQDSGIKDLGVLTLQEEP